MGMIKLREKKTGVKFLIKITINGKEYQSLAELNDDFEDYEPVEPLIEDEKPER